MLIVEPASTAMQGPIPQRIVVSLSRMTMRAVTSPVVDISVRADSANSRAVTRQILSRRVESATPTTLVRKASVVLWTDSRALVSARRIPIVAQGSIAIGVSIPR